MNFYEDRVSIVKMNEREIYIFRNKNSEITMDYYSMEEDHKSVSICNDAYGEFDTIVEDKKISLVYQDTKNNLKLLSIDNKSVEETETFKDKLTKIYEVKLSLDKGLKSIIYLLPKFSEKGAFEIHHKFFKDGEWADIKVDETRISMFLNPIKILSNESALLLFFYYGNQICMKTFDLNSLKWNETIVLTDGGEKLYIDVIYDERYIHLVYSEYIEQNLSIKYKRYEYREDSLYEGLDKTISNEGNTTHPTLILYHDKIWIVWRDSLGLNSSFSKDSGETFSDIYLWKKAKLDKYVKYVYKEKEVNDKFKLNSSFGTIYPDIKFLGFGDLRGAQKIVRKNK